MIEYTSDTPRHTQSKMLVLMMAVNLAMAIASLTAWAYVRLSVAQPLSWATSQIVGENPDFLDYPFVLLWALPIFAVLVARSAAKWGAKEMAFGVAMLSPTLFATIMALFYLGPIGWR